MNVSTIMRNSIFNKNFYKDIVILKPMTCPRCQRKNGHYYVDHDDFYVCCNCHMVIKVKGM